MLVYSIRGWKVYLISSYLVTLFSLGAHEVVQYGFELNAVF